MIYAHLLPQAIPAGPKLQSVMLTQKSKRLTGKVNDLRPLCGLVFS